MIMWDNDADDQGGAPDNDADDKRALLAQLGGMKMPMLGARGGGVPTSNTMPIRERAPINDNVAAAPSPLPAPPTSAEAPTQPLDQQPMDQPDIGSSIGALAGMLKQPQQMLPPPPTPHNIGAAVQGVGNALKPQNVFNALKPRNVGNALRNPLVALGGLFGRRR